MGRQSDAGVAVQEATGPHEVIDQVWTWHELTRRLVPGRPRPVVIGVDGFSGSGKTWFADRLAALTGATVVRTDDIVPGWDRLTDGIERVRRDLLGPWATGSPADVPTWDWDGSRPGPRLRLPVPTLAVVEGSGIGSVHHSGLLDVLVWMDSPAPVRSARLDARADHDTYRPFRALWAAQEQALAARAGSRARADLLVRTCTRASLLVGLPGATDRSVTRTCDPADRDRQDPR